MLGLGKKDVKFLMIVIFLTLATPILLQPFPEGSGLDEAAWSSDRVTSGIRVEVDEDVSASAASTEYHQRDSEGGGPTSQIVDLSLHKD